MIDLVVDGKVRRLVAEHIDPEKARAAEHALEEHPLYVGEDNPITRVISTGKARFQPHVMPEMLEEAARDPEELETIKREGIVSVIMAPLVARGACIGVLTVVTCESERVYDEQDFAFVEELGRRAGVAIANAQMHAAVEETQERLRIALDAGSTGTWDSDLTTGSLVWDERTRAIYGFAPGSPIDREIVNRCLHPDDREAAAESLRRAVAPGASGELAMEYRILRASDGAERWVSVRGRIFFEGSYPVRMVGTIVDTTELKQAEAERADLLARERAARAEAEAANRIKDEFLATVSHELRTPLNAITGWASLLTQKPHDAAVLAKGLDVIRRNAQAQAKIIEDILDVSRIITGKLRIDPRPIDLLAVVRDAMDVVRPSADAKEQTMTLWIPDDGGCLLVGDAQRLQQVVWNLLSNAVKFTDRGGQIAVRVEQQGSSLELTVSDTGRGIDADLLPHVFERFRQGDSSPSRKFGGLGLGLAIVRHIVELHGGRVSAESPGSNAGSTFRIALPIRAVAPAPSAEDRPTPSSLPGRSSAGSHGNIAGMRILVIDDEADARELVETVLLEEGAIVETSASAREAFDVLTRFSPDVIVSDIGMPDEDGYSFIGTLRARSSQNGGGVPAIALTAYARPEDRLRALQAGFNTHVVKPVDARELIAIITNFRAVGVGAASTPPPRPSPPS